MSSPRRPLRLLTLSAALVFTTVACGSDDDDMDDGVDQTEVTSASGSAVPGQPQEPVNTDTEQSQVAPTIRP